MTVYFCNSEAIDLNAIALMGVSVKSGTNPIGYFGTGLKFSIATLLRFGCKVKLIREGETIPFTIVNEAVRGEDFDRIVMGDERLGFTTKLGRNWETWQAYRELYCNCLDEGGVISDNMPDGKFGTIFAIEGEAIEQAHRSRHEIFLSTNPIAEDATCAVHRGETQHAFYRGVRAHKHQLLALFTYNVKSSLTLTEDRTVKESYHVGYYVARFLPTIEDEDVIEQIILAPQGTFENGLNFDHGITPSAAFMRAAFRHRHNLHANQTAIKLWEKNADVRFTYEAVTIDDYDERQIVEATRLLRRLQCPIERDDFIIVSSLGGGVFGMVRRGQILIAKGTLDLGSRFIASTLYEEWLHKNDNFEDESRNLQNYLFEKLFAMTERVVAMEAA